MLAPTQTSLFPSQAVLEPIGSQPKVNIQCRIVEVAMQVLLTLHQNSSYNKTSSLDDKKEHKILTNQQIGAKQIQGVIPIGLGFFQLGLLSLKLPQGVPEIIIGAISKCASFPWESQEIESVSKKELVSMKLNNANNDVQGSTTERATSDAVRDVIQIASSASRS